MSLKPIVKWAGGKRQLLPRLLEKCPQKFNYYFEPFVGGGALLFALMPKTAVINDVNKELLAIYHCFQEDELFDLLLKELDTHEKNHSENYYLEIRNLDRQQRFELEPLWKRAARTIYLNKACFNGLYRVNSKGYFDVPSGKKTVVKTYDKLNMPLLHEFFKNNEIIVTNSDFAESVRTAKNGDFVYFDPPYDSYKQQKSFTAYTKFDFTKEDQVRLSKLFKELSDKGIKCMLSNHNTELIRELYKDFNIEVVPAKRTINSKADGRGNVMEVIITNYKNETK